MFSTGPGRPSGRPWRRRVGLRLGLIAALVAVLFVTPTVSSLYVDLRWFESLGFRQIFTTLLWTRVAVGAAFGLAFATFLVGNVQLGLRISEGMKSVVLQDPTGTTRFDVGALVRRLALPIALFASVVAALVASEQWDTWLLWSNASDFGKRDPILGWEVGFYVFDLPFWTAVVSYAIATVGFTFAALVVLYVARGGIATAPALRLERKPRAHLLLLGALLLVGFAAEAWLAIPNLMYSDLGPTSGASYADVKAKLPALQGQVGAALLAAVLVAVSAARTRLILAVAGVALFVASELLAVRAYPAMVHRFSVVPNEAQKEAPYIQHNIDATRAAYGLSEVSERELKTQVSLTRQDLDNNRATIENVRLWDHEQLLDTFAQIQEIRTYYEFASVDNDRYVIDGQLRQTMLSPRELSAESLPNQTWINEHFTFTHGYGITLGPVNTATREGLPQLFIQDIPPTSELEGFKVQRPEIYFGELSNEYALVRTKNREFDYPSGEENVYTEYQGTGGIPLDSSVFLVAASVRLTQLKLLLSEDIESRSRLLLYRNIADRVRKVAPFLRFDRDPYLVLRKDGSFSWVQDAYTTTDRYPYAQPTVSTVLGRINYVRNSVKVVVDAYDGDVTLYVADQDDPILKTWQRIFPGAFEPMSKMDDDLRAHLRYPEDIFRIQTQVFTVYHMDRPELVYNQEDRWEIPTIRRAGATSAPPMVPYYTVMRLPGEDQAEFIQMLPFTPARKQNLSAWMVARMDGERLGELVVYRFPKDRLVFGPQQVMNRIDQEEDISRQISLWDQRGSEAILGTLLVIPVEESLLYVVPLYLRAQGGRIPELKRVIVAYENRIAMEPTLDGAVDALFGPKETTAPEALAATDAGEEAEPTATEGGPTEDAGEATASRAQEPRLALRARRRFEEAIKAQRAGDWAKYGEKLEELEEILSELAPKRSKGKASN